MKLLLAAVLAALVTAPVCGAQEDLFTRLESCCGVRAQGLVTRLPIHDVPVFEMIVISDCSSPNVALNRNTAYNKVDTDVSVRTVYLQAPDGKRGLQMEFEKPEYNRLRMYDRVKLDLNGCKIRMDAATRALYITNVTPLNIVSRRAGRPEDAVVKSRHISELTDGDVFTLVRLEDVEFAFKEGAIVNIDEPFGLYVPSIHPTIRGRMLCYGDGAVVMLRDINGDVLPMGVNTLCDWRKQAAPRGMGSVTGVITVEKNRRYGDAAPRMYVRPLFREDIKISDSRKTSPWKTWLGWFPGRMPGNDFDFEKAGFGPKGIDDRLLNNVGPKSYFSTDAGERRIQKAGSFNSLKTEDGFEAGGSIKLYGTVRDWYWWNGDGTVKEGRSVYVEVNPSKLKASRLQFCFEMAGGDGDILNSRGIPIRWKVEYSVEDGDWKPLKEADGDETFGLRPLPANTKADKKYGRTYYMMYDFSLGMQQHCFNLPQEVIGKSKLTVRISPCVDRWFHLSGNAARDAEYPDATVNLVKENNKTYSTVRFGTIFFDYK